MAILSNLCTFAALGLLLIGSTMNAGAGEPLADEYQVKALFLYNFAKFVEWPDRPFETPKQAFTICVIGSDPFGHWLPDAGNGRGVNGRTVAVQYVSNPEEAKSCRILFIASSEEKRLPSLVAAVKSKGILTVADYDRACEMGVIVNFTLEGGRVRFEINPEAAEYEKLRISSRLLSLARIVKSGPAQVTSSGETDLIRKPPSRK